MFGENMNRGALSFYQWFMTAWYAWSNIGAPLSWEFLAPASIFFMFYLAFGFDKNSPNKDANRTALYNYTWAIALTMAINTQTGVHTKMDAVWGWTYFVLFTISMLDNLFHNLRN